MLCHYKTPYANIGQICLRLLCLLTLVAAGSCTPAVSPTYETSPTPTPRSTATPVSTHPSVNPTATAAVYGFDTRHCSTSRQLLPRVCGVVPGLTTFEETAELLREPNPIMSPQVTCQDKPVLGVESAEHCYGYPGKFLIVYVSDGVVVGLTAELTDTALTLGKAVDELGTPSQVFIGYSGGSQEVDRVFFLWPEQGIYMFRAHIDEEMTRILEGGEPLPSGLVIHWMSAFVPSTPEEMERHFVDVAIYWMGRDRENDRWIDWPGMIE